MSLTLATLLYLSQGIALSILQLNRGRRLGDALFSGLFWPMAWGARCIETVAATVTSDTAAAKPVR